MRRTRAFVVASAATMAIGTATISIPTAALGNSSVAFTDLQVNNSSSGAPPTKVQREPSIAENPTNPLNLVVSSWHGIDEPACTDSTPSVCPDEFPRQFAVSTEGYFASFDGGKTFPCQGPIDLSALGVYANFDAWVTFDSGGTAYYGVLAEPLPPGQGPGFGQSVFVAKSTDGGCTWGSPARVSGSDGRAADKDSIAADANGTSPFRDNVYATWDRFSPRGFGDQIMFSRSIDGGATWSPALPISPGNDTGGFKSGPLIQVAPNGTVYVLWGDKFPLNSPTSPVLRISISYDGGKTFPKRGALAASYDTEDPAGSVPGTQLPTWSFPSLSVALDGTLYASFTRRANDHTVVMLARSTDGGLVWTAPVVTADIAGRSAFFPALAVDPNGKVNLVLNAVDDVPPGTTPGEGVVHYDTYWVQSSDGGSTFTDPFKISSAPSDPDVSIFTGCGFPDCYGQFIGDYISAVADASHVYTAWTDTRNGSACRAMDDFLFGGGPAPDVITHCPVDWDNADIYLGTVSY
jgi:hypothetical protein